MERPAALLCLVASLAASAVGGCGTTERSADVGDTLSAKGLRATVETVDDSVPVPRSDITGLSQPTPGSKLVGARVRVCSDHGGAIGPYDFGLETTDGHRLGAPIPEPGRRPVLLVGRALGPSGA